MKYFSVCFALLAAIAANSANTFSPNEFQTLNNKFKFKTFRYFGIIEKRLPDISAALDNNSLLIYQPSLKENDTLSFSLIDLKENKLKKINVYVPSISSKIKNPRATKIAFSGKYIVVIFFEQMLILSFQGNSTLLYQDLVPLNERIGYIGIIDDNIVLAKAYNFHPFDQATKTFIGLYNIPNKTISNQSYPIINNVEYSHFIPNDIFAFNNNYIAVSQYDKYKVEILNKDLSLKLIIADSLRLDLDENYYQEKLDTFKKLKSIPQMLDSISFLSEKIERIERVFLIDSQTIAVQIKERKSPNSLIYRRMDLWELNSKNRERKISYRENCFDLSKFKVTDVVNYLNYPISLNDPIVLLNSNYLVTITRGSNVDYFGKTKNAITEEEEKFFESTQPGFRVEYFDVLKSTK